MRIATSTALLRCLVFLVVGVCASAIPAHADRTVPDQEPPPAGADAESLSAYAKRLFIAGRYREAAEALLTGTFDARSFFLTHHTSFLLQQESSPRLHAEVAPRTQKHRRPRASILSGAGSLGQQQGKVCLVLVLASDHGGSVAAIDLDGTIAGDEDLHDAGGNLLDERVDGFIQLMQGIVCLGRELRLRA